MRYVGFRAGLNRLENRYGVVRLHTKSGLELEVEVYPDEGSFADDIWHLHLPLGLVKENAESFHIQILVYNKVKHQCCVNFR